ncbi:MAG: TetR family transcriptional regulator [Firmicutes bacterium]|nr:TetR family transcriptional regulator [Bacillota bacterium]
MKRTNIKENVKANVKRERNSQKSKEDILKAAEIKFAEKGIYGTRVDDIAEAANINKRMLYEYFGNKEELYRAVLVEVYSRLSKQEMVLLSENICCIDAMKRIINLYFDFLKNNPTYVNLILWENLNKGEYIKDIDFSGIKDPVFNLLRKVINKGKSDGIFRSDVDTEQVILSLLTCSFSYFSNRYTLSKLLGRKIDTEESIKKRIDTVTEMFLRYLCV